MLSLRVMPRNIILLLAAVAALLAGASGARAASTGAVRPLAGPQGAAAAEGFKAMPRLAAAKLLSTAPLNASRSTLAVPSDGSFLAGGVDIMRELSCVQQLYEDGVWSYAEYTPGAKAGQRFYLRVTMQELGTTCSGELVAPSINAAPAGLFFAIDQDNPVKCEVHTAAHPDAWFDVTDSTSVLKNSSGQYYTPCHHDKIAGAYAILARGQGFRLTFPVYSKVPLTSATFQATIDTAIARSEYYSDQKGHPSVPLYVGENPPAISYPSPSTGEVTTSTAHSVATVASHFRPGSIYMELGDAAGHYTHVEGPFDVGDTSDSWRVDQNWSGLQPATTYHWRARFVGGGTYVGPDQTFTTQAGPPVADTDHDGVPDSRDACPTTPASGSVNGCPAGQKPPVVTPPPAPKPSLAVPGGQKLRSVLKSGLKVTLTCRARCSVKLALALDRASAKRYRVSSALGGASVSLAGAGSRTVTVKLPSRARPRLARARAIKVTVSAAGAPSVTATLRR